LPGNIRTRAVSGLRQLGLTKATQLALASVSRASSNAAALVGQASQA
jgi:hypothetical protein